MKIQRYSVGECEMLPRDRGQWLELTDVLLMLDRITDDDDRDAMLAKIKEIQAQLSGPRARA